VSKERLATYTKAIVAYRFVTPEWDLAFGRVVHLFLLFFVFALGERKNEEPKIA
jgi:hypothetical protein